VALASAVAPDGSKCNAATYLLPPEQGVVTKVVGHCALQVVLLSHVIVCCSMACFVGHFCELREVWEAMNQTSMRTSLTPNTPVNLKSCSECYCLLSCMTNTILCVQQTRLQYLDVVMQPFLPCTSFKLKKHNTMLCVQQVHLQCFDLVMQLFLPCKSCRLK